MKVGFIGCVQSSMRALEVLLKLAPEGIIIVGVITKKSSEINADFVDLVPFCAANKVPFHYEDPKERDKSVEFMRELQPDVIYCFGWSYLLPQQFLDLPPLGVIGFHPAALPQNRGRHPIIWALALGLSETASSFFRMDEGADSGPLLSQEMVEICSDDDSSTLYSKILTVASGQIERFTRRLANGTAKFVEQNHAHSSYWRKRSKHDGRIDWRMRASDIHNLIRALHRPYPGAEFQFGDRFIKAWRSEVSCKHHAKNIEPGRILEVQGSSVLVKCGQNSALWLHEFEPRMELKQGQYI